MAQKASPNLVRLGYNRIWKSEWSGLFNYSQNLMDDLIIRNYFSYIFYCLKCPTNYIILKRSFSSWLYVHIEVYLPEDQRRRFYILFNRSFYGLKDKRINLLKKKKYFLYAFHSLFYKFSKFLSSSFHQRFTISYYKHHMFLLPHLDRFSMFTWNYSFFFYLFFRLFFNHFNFETPVVLPRHTLVSHFNFFSSRFNSPFFTFRSILANKLSNIKFNLCNLLTRLSTFKTSLLHYFYFFHIFFLFVKCYKSLKRFSGLSFFFNSKLLFTSYYIKSLHDFLKKNHAYISLGLSHYFIVGYFTRALLFSGIYYNFFFPPRVSSVNVSLLKYVSFFKTFNLLRFLFLRKKRNIRFFPKFSLTLLRKKKLKNRYSAFFFSFVSWFVRILRIKMLSAISKRGDFKRYIRSGGTLAMMKELSRFLKNPVHAFMINVLRYRFFLYFKKLHRKISSYKLRNFCSSLILKKRFATTSAISAAYYRNSIYTNYLSFRNFFLKRFFKSLKMRSFNKYFFGRFFNFVFLRGLKSKKDRRILALYRLYLREKHYYLYRSRFKYKLRFKFKFSYQFSPSLPMKRKFFKFLAKFKKLFLKKSWYFFNKYNSFFNKRKYARFFKRFKSKYRRYLKSKSTTFFTRSVIKRRIFARDLKIKARRNFMRLFKKSLPFSKKHMSFFYKHRMYANRVLLHWFFKRKFGRSLIVPRKFIRYRNKKRKNTFYKIKFGKYKFRTLKFLFPKSFYKKVTRRYGKTFFSRNRKRKFFSRKKYRFKSKIFKFRRKSGFLRKMNLVGFSSFFVGRLKNKYRFKIPLFTYNKLLCKFIFFMKQLMLSYSNHHSPRVFFYQNHLFSNLFHLVRNYSIFYKFQNSNVITNHSGVGFFRTFYLNFFYAHSFMRNYSSVPFYFFRKKISFFLKFYKRYLRFFCLSSINLNVKNKYFLFRKVFFYLSNCFNSNHIFLLVFFLRYQSFLNKINLYSYLLKKRYFLKLKNHVMHKLKSLRSFKDKSRYLFSSRLRFKIQVKNRIKFDRKKSFARLRFRNDFFNTYLKYYHRFFYLYRNKNISLLKSYGFFPDFYNSFRKRVLKRYKKKRAKMTRHRFKYILNYNYLFFLFKQFNFTLQSTLNNSFTTRVCLDIRYFLNNRRPLIKSASLISDFVSFELKKGVPINEVLSDLSYWFRIDRKLKSKLKMDTKFNLMNYVQLYYSNIISSAYFYHMKLINLKQHIQSYKVFSYYKRNDLNSLNSPHFNVFGYRIMCSGRPFGQPRTATYTRWYGKMPLSTINYNVDYSYNYAITKYGVIGIKVWIFFG